MAEKITVECGAGRKFCMSMILTREIYTNVKYEIIVSLIKKTLILIFF